MVFLVPHACLLTGVLGEMIISPGRGGPRTMNPDIGIWLSPSCTYWLPWPSHWANCSNLKRMSCIFYFNLIGRVCNEKSFFFFPEHTVVLFIGLLPYYRMWRVNQFLNFVIVISSNKPQVLMTSSPISYCLLTFSYTLAYLWIFLSTDLSVLFKKHVS